MTQVPLLWGPSPQGRALVAAGVVGVALALLLRRPELLALVTPALWAVLTTARPPEPARVRVEPFAAEVRADEGGLCELRLTVSLENRVAHLGVELALPTELVGVARQNAVEAHRIDLAVDVRAQRWGRHAIGPVRVHALSSGGLRTAGVDVPVALTALVLPVPRPWRAASAPPLLPDRSGEHVTRTPGAGLEPVAVRPFAAGDAVRRVNWRVTSRRGSLHVTATAAERAVDLVLVVDARSDVGAPPDSSLDRAVRGASAMALRWLRDRDRVGLVVLGAPLRWLTPGSGRLQRQRIAEAVLHAAAAPGEVPPDLTRLPGAALPPGAVVVVLTPLLDDGALAALADLRARFRHVLVVDVLGNATPFVAPDDRAGQLAVRLWLLERAALVRRLEERGTPVLLAEDGTLERLLALALRIPP